MEAIVPQPRGQENDRLVAALPAHVVAALDHLAAAERSGVHAAIDAFTHQKLQGEAIPGPDPLFILWAAPEVRVIVRREDPTAPAEVEDIVRPATLRIFAQAHAS